MVGHAASLAVLSVPVLLLLGCRPGACRDAHDSVGGDRLAEHGRSRQGLKRRLPEEGGYRHLGCFADEIANPLMDFMLEVKEMTIDMCYETCLQDPNSAYFGVGHGEGCWCSSDPHLDYNRNQAGTCDRWCGGDASTVCGGEGALDVYAIDHAPEPQPLLGFSAGALESVLELHNAARCMHGAKPLRFAETVAMTARAYAGRLTSEANCGSMEVEHKNDLGENVFVCAGPSDAALPCASAQRAMSIFYEGQLGRGGTSTYGARAKQVLWKPTTQLGCGLDTCRKNGLTYSVLVCHYSPPMKPGVLATEAELEPKIKSSAECGYHG